MEYTKGEWRVNDCAFKLFYRQFVVDDDLNEIAEAQGITLEQAEANAHLIAAAPDIYEALEAIINSETITSKDNFNNALEALSKADGKGD